MSDDQVSLPYLLVFIVAAGLAVRYLFFSPSNAPSSSRTPEATLRAREAAVENIQQMFPQTDRRHILWDLQRNRGNVQSTIERILAGRLETPPITFQPPPPAGQSSSSVTSAAAAKAPEKPSQPDLITRYNLKSRLDEVANEQGADSDGKKTKGWSSNRDERQSSLQKRRDEMILAARRKMEAKMAAENSEAMN